MTSKHRVNVEDSFNVRIQSSFSTERQVQNNETHQSRFYPYNYELE